MSESTEQRRGRVAEFAQITGASAEHAEFYLAANDYNLEGALSSFFDNPPGDGLSDQLQDEDIELEDEPPSPPPIRTHQPIQTPSIPQTMSGDNKKPAAGGSSRRVATLGDLNSQDHDDHEGHDHGDEGQDYFAGGEKSGVMVHGTGTKQPNPAADLVNDILSKAAKAGPPPESSSKKDKKPATFAGSGYRLGSEEDPAPTAPAASVAQSLPQAPVPLEPVERQLTFWRNGFSIDDGELRDYKDPANEEFLRAINSGRAPTTLLNVAYGQPVEVKVAKRMEEDYKPPPKKPAAPFGGSGHRLGAPVPGDAALGGSSSGAGIPGSFPGGAAPAVSSVPFVFSVDDSKPVTSIQLRLADGTRMIAKFNHSHTVGDLRRFINHSRPGTSGTPYVLMTTFPNKELTDESATLQAAGLVNSVVVQKMD
ncbi:hypothetical protein SmJEL517_g01716 [Synchytrium microbalum]|uniref:UBX domain-containing protein n=1 Tax=Synchytrium microbalum TaxID=1806994 RepID=A0A507CA40_9FUNG|nr:uncharacterized protein SmJEL517_g01716 [Synchytrium microbalum]TPX36039.1 hypothetical protein SmJEL517_g01716 [Synchytrium microbalum]